MTGFHKGVGEGVQSVGTTKPSKIDSKLKRHNSYICIHVFETATTHFATMQVEGIKLQISSAPTCIG